MGSAQDRRKRQGRQSFSRPSEAATTRFEIRRSRFGLLGGKRSSEFRKHLLPALGFALAPRHDLGFPGETQEPIEALADIGQIGRALRGFGPGEGEEGS